MASGNSDGKSGGNSERGLHRLRGLLASFAVRIMVLLVAISVGPLVALGWLQDYYTREMLAELDESRVTQQLEVVLDRLTAHLADRFAELDMLAENALIQRQFLQHSQPSHLRELTASLTVLPLAIDLLLVSAEGRVLTSLSDSQLVPEIDWEANLAHLPFRNLYQERDRGLLGPTWLTGAQHESVFLFQRVYRDHQAQDPIGLVVMHLDVADLVAEMRSQATAAGDTEGTEALVPYLQSPLGDYYPRSTDGAAQPNKIVANTPLLEGWELVISVEESLLMAPLRQLRRTLLIVFLGVLGGVLALIAMFYRSSAGRIHQLTRGAEAIAQGNLDWRLADHGHDELSRLSAAFNGMAEQLRSLIASTVQTEKMASLGKLATTIAHEVRNPLASIKTGAQVVAEDLQDADQKRILDNVIAEIDRLNRVASELLNFSRPFPAQSQETPIAEIIARVRALVDRQAAQNDIAIAEEIEDGLQIRVDPNQMQQVLMNLVLNSIQAMPDGGHLTFQAKRQDRRVTIQVQDTGVGITPDLIERVQRLFVSSRPDGTGIGLAVSRQLIERNQGQLSITSTPQQGTTVTLSFPIG